MVELELGNIVFNSNTNQQYQCPRYIIALLRDIDRTLDLVMHNIYQKDYESPFGNTGNSFTDLSNLFEVHAYNWNDDESHEFNFVFRTKPEHNCPDIKISWYKYLGRDMTINIDVKDKSSLILELYENIIKELMIYEEKKSNEVRKQSYKERLNRDADWIIQPESAESIKLLIKGVRDSKYKDIILYFEDLSNLCEDINITLMNNYLDGKISVVSRTCGGKKE